MSADIGYAKDSTLSWERYADLLKLRLNAKDQITAGKIYRQIAEKGNIDAIKALAEYIEKKAF